VTSPTHDSHGRSTDRSDPRDRFRGAVTTGARARLAKPLQTQTQREGDSVRVRGSADFLETKGELQERLLEEIGEQESLGRRREDIEGFVREFVGRVLENETLPLNDAERERLATELTEEAIGLGPLAPLMADPAVTDILEGSAFREAWEEGDFMRLAQGEEFRGLFDRVLEELRRNR
jgi:hypothetical protein